MPNKPLFILNPSETIADLKDVYFPPYITLAHLFHAPADWYIHNRVLKQYQIQYAVSGVAEYQIEDRTYTTKTGDLLLHRPHQRHSVFPKSQEPYVCISIVFHFGNTAFPIDELTSPSHYIGNFRSHGIEKKLTQLITQYRQPGIVHQMHAQVTLLDVLLELQHWNHEQYSKKASTVQKNNLAKMIRVKNYIMEHFYENLLLPDLERLSGLSKDYLIRQYNKTFGMTPIQYLIHLRVEKAKEYALQSGLSISEIAQKVGYSDVHTFGKMFKKKTGISLSQFCASLFMEDPNPDGIKGIPK